MTYESPALGILIGKEDTGALVHNLYPDIEQDYSCSLVEMAPIPVNTMGYDKKIDKEGFKLWMELFCDVHNIEQLREWENKISNFSCECNPFYTKYKEKNQPEVLDLEWKWKLKNAVNKKLRKGRISLEEARWQYRFTQERGPIHNLISNADLIRDSKLLGKLIYNRHPNIMGVAGVARSGMLPATIIALDLGIDLYEATPEGIRLITGGVRRTGTIHGTRRQNSGTIVIVDDSTCSGHAARVLSNLNRPHYVVYGASPGKYQVDGYAVPLELPHLFQWNLLHNGLIFKGMKAAFDMDGVFCEDCPIECDDDSFKYLDWMEGVQPLHYSIEYEIDTIITARRSVYRRATKKWLKKHGINVKNLVMFPGTFEERSRTNIGQWKANKAKELGCIMFVESDYRQALEINRTYPNCLTVSIERIPNGYAS